MKGHAQLSSRGCVANLAVCRSLAVRVWLPGAWMDSQRVAGNRHHIPKANWLHAHGVLQRLRGSLTSTWIPVYAWFHLH